MLPSAGLFQDISCPFYENGACDRPYCHFRHVKKDVYQKNTTDKSKSLQEEYNASNNDCNKATYNPTPIAVLEKIQNSPTDSKEFDVISRRHIPVPYTPLRPIIPKPNADAKRQVYFPGSKQDVTHELYKPPGYSPSKDVYLPGSVDKVETYKPDSNSINLNSNSYVPTDLNEKPLKKNKKRLEYEPKPVNKSTELKNSVKYEPTPLSVTVPKFSSDEEDETEIKKSRLSEECNDFDNLDSEFEILGQILEQENQKEELETAKEREKLSLKQNHKSKSDHKKERSSDKHSTDKHKDHKSKYKDKKHSKDSKEKSSKDRESRHDKHKSKESTNKESSKEKRRHESSRSKSDKHSSSSRHSEKSKSDRHKENRDTKSHKDKKKDHNDSSRSKDKHKKNDEVIMEVNNYEEADDSVEEISDADEETIAMECKKIFEEYVPTPINKISTESEEAPFIQPQDEDDVYVPTKKRISHSIVTKSAPKPVAKLDYKSRAAQVLSERIAKTKQYHTTLNPETNIGSNSTQSQIASSTGKVRIAHVPYVSTMLDSKKNIPISNSQPSTSHTIVQTVAKGSTRMAHVPSEKISERPGVLEPLASKIPANLRSIYLNLMIDECIKIYIEPVDAYARAQHEELTTSKKCNTIPIYKNSAMLAISRIRKELQESNGIKKSAAQCSTLNKMSHNDVLLGKIGLSSSWSIEKRNKHDNLVQEFLGINFYNNLIKWTLTEEQLRSNGFPRPHPNGEKGRAMIYVTDKRKMQPPEGNTRVCCRCKKTYVVTKTGFPKVLEDCIYHPNNKYRYRGEVKYQCCSQDSSSDGCTIAPTHVFEYVDYENLKGYVRTMPRECPNGDYGIYALDCEMCYTTHGLDLTRITVINSRCKVEYETFIKPLHPIIDYNTRYSGITEEQMKDITTTLIEVQATLLHMFSEKTILIGHSLESDFKALKIIHDTVIDTSVLFPHKMGPPYKRALRNLSSEYLKKIIQNSVEGHDSAEDATVCMELVIFKLREELKLR